MEGFALFFENYIAAWVAVLLAVLTALKFIARKALAGSQSKPKALKLLNSPVLHIVLGVLLIFFGLIHGIFSSDSVLSFNLGTICWVASVLLWARYMLRGFFGKPRAWLMPHRLLTVLFVALIIWHVIDVGGIRVFAEYERLTRPVVQVTEISGDLSQYQFNDGVYRGVADGYGKELTVDVTVEGGSVTAITIVSHNEERELYYGKPMRIIPAEITDRQTLAVDDITGATFTSKGIKNAVADALLKAVRQ